MSHNKIFNFQIGLFSSLLIRETEFRLIKLLKVATFDDKQKRFANTEGAAGGDSTTIFSCCISREEKLLGPDIFIYYCIITDLSRETCQTAS